MPKHIVKRLERLDYLICTKATGTPGQLAEKLNLSEQATVKESNGWGNNYIELRRHSMCSKIRSRYWQKMQLRY